MAPAASADASDARVVRWRGETDGRLRAAFRHVVASVFVLVGLGLLAAVGLFAVAAVTEGVTDTVVLLVVLTLVGGPFSLLYLVAVRREASLSAFLPYELNLNPRYVLLALPVGAAVLASWVWFPPVAYVYLLSAPLLWGFVAARDSSGELDAEAGTLTYDDGTAATEAKTRDVRTLRAHAAWRVGGYRVVRLRYGGSLSFSKPSFVVVPAADYPAVDSALSTVERTDYGVDVSGTSSLAKAVLAGFGLLFVGVAVGLVALEGGGDGVPVIAALVAPFGLLFVALAWFA